MFWWTLAACDTSSVDDPGCLHRDLDDWCFHSESEDGPDVPAGGSCPVPTEEPQFRCGEYDLYSASGGFTSESLYFDGESGELVAVRYTTDVNTYCGGFSYWYGRRIDDCGPLCTYGPESDEVPVCD